jgi:soluble P-type ATPase
MLKIDIPGFKQLKLENLVLDYNGTLACDGQLLSGVKERLKDLSANLQIHILTADTFGKSKSQLTGVPASLTITPLDSQEKVKVNYVQKLGASKTVCIGNGRNDRLMLKEAALGIAVIQEECAAAEAVLAADIASHGILAALDLLLNPLRLVATLRS